MPLLRIVDLLAVASIHSSKPASPSRLIRPNNPRIPHETPAPVKHGRHARIITQQPQPSNKIPYELPSICFAITPSILPAISSLTSACLA